MAVSEKDMMVSLFDVQAGFGGPVRGETDTVGAAELVAELERLDVAGALVHTVPDDLAYDAVDANTDLYDACETRPKLIPCPILIPAGACDVPPEPVQAAEAIARGAAAAFLRPQTDRWFPEPWCSAALFEAIEERRLPAYCEVGKFDLSHVAAIAERHPRLPLIVAGLHYLQQRSLMPLMEARPNVYVAIGSNYVVYGGIEVLVEKIAPERILFGTGFPKAEAMSAVTMLMYAAIPEDARALIGAGNFRRLAEEIER
jgi:hypothetical protein